MSKNHALYRETKSVFYVIVNTDYMDNKELGICDANLRPYFMSTLTGLTLTYNEVYYSKKDAEQWIEGLKKINKNYKIVKVTNTAIVSEDLDD